MIVRKGVPIDWPLLIAALREEIGWFVLLVVMGFVFGGVGVLVAIPYENWLDFGALLIGGIFLLCGIALLVAAFIGPVSSVGYHYHQGLLGKHGVNVDAVLTKNKYSVSSIRIMTTTTIHWVKAISTVICSLSLTSSSTEATTVALTTLVRRGFLTSSGAGIFCH